MLKLWCLLAYLTLLVSAIPQLEERALPQCSAVPTVNNRLSRCATATGFCQSFLHTTTTRATVRTTITKTITKQVTDSTTTSTTTFTTTETEEAPTSTVTTSTDHVTATDTCSAISVETSSGSNMAKRAVLEPRATPSCGVKNQPIRDVSAGCSCLLFPTRTLRPKTTTFTTVTTTTETTVISDATTTTTTPLTSAATTVSDGACPTPSGCSNQGINWAYHTYVGSDDTTTYKNREPSAQGVTPDLGNFNDGTTMFYGYNAGSSENLALEHTTYIFAPQTGTYTFEFLDLDDYARVWLGDKAYQGWNDDNADIDASTNALDSPYTMNLEQGSYTAFRLIWVQGGGPGHMHFQITSPDGTIIMSSYDNGSVHPPYLVTQSCDGTTAPPFPPFGMEGPSSPPPTDPTPSCPDDCTCPVAAMDRFTFARRTLTTTTCDSTCPQCPDGGCTSCVCEGADNPDSQATCDPSCEQCTTPAPTGPNCPDMCTCPTAVEEAKRAMTLKRSVFGRRGTELTLCDADCPQCPGGGCTSCVCEGADNPNSEPTCDSSCEQCATPAPTCPDMCTCPLAGSAPGRLRRSFVFGRRDASLTSCDSTCPQCPDGGCMDCVCAGADNPNNDPTCDASCSSCTPVTPLCNRADYSGLQFAVFDKNSDPYSTTAPQSQGSYDSAGLLQTTASYRGSGVNRIGPFFSGQSDTTTFYSDTNAPAMNVLVDHQGYFVPPTDGDYTVTFTDLDDLGLLWVTADYVNNPNNGNSAIFAYFDDSTYIAGQPQTTNTKSMLFTGLTQGTYYPLRVRYGGGKGYNHFDFSITDSSGTDVNDGSHMVYFSQGCDGDNAPALQPYMTSPNNEG